MQITATNDSKATKVRKTTRRRFGSVGSGVPVMVDVSFILKGCEFSVSFMLEAVVLIPLKILRQNYRNIVIYG